MDCSMPGSPVLHYLWDFTHVHWKLCHPAISSCHPLLLLSSIFPSIALLPRNKCALNLWMQSLTTVTLVPKKISLSLFQLFPHLFAVKWWDLLRNLFAGQEATVRTGQGTTDWFQIRKGVCQGCILSPCLVNLYAEYIIRNIGLDEAQARINIAGRHINNLRYEDDTTLMAEREEELKSLLMKLRKESEKVGLKINIQKMEIMACSPITSWQINGETVETVTEFYCRGLQNHCRWWLQPWNLNTLTLWRKVMTNIDSILKNRDITLPTKVHLVKAMIFPVVMYGCESWTIKKAVQWRIDAFELWC